MSIAECIDINKGSSTQTQYKERLYMNFDGNIEKIYISDYLLGDIWCNFYFTHIHTQGSAENFSPWPTSWNQYFTDQASEFEEDG